MHFGSSIYIWTRTTREREEVETGKKNQVYIYMVIFMNVTKHPNVYGLCNKNKKSMKPVKYLHSFRFVIDITNNLLLPFLLLFCDLFIFSSRFLQLLFQKDFLLFLFIFFFFLSSSSLSFFHLLFLSAPLLEYQESI